jgi:hypothetical protein
MHRASILAAVVLAGFQRADSQAASAPVPFKVSSSIAELRIVPTTRLPKNRKAERLDEYCSNYAILRPKTPGGRLAKQGGWIVTSETKLGNYDAVTFVRALEAATSGTCAHEDGNLGIFEGPRVKAVVFEPAPSAAADPNDLGALDSLGSAEQINAKRIRLNWGLPSPPFADVIFRDGVSVEPIAKEDPVCKGAAAVPNVFGQDIRKARKRLIAYGWRPSRSKDSLHGGIEGELRAQGVVETESCSGTGYGFCGFDYRHPGGMSLSVLSTGDDYSVISYAVQCGRRQR